MNDGLVRETREQAMLEHFARWVADHSGEQAGANSVALFERPTTDFISRLQEARAGGASRFCFGFLPDEVDWPSGGRDDPMGWFLERMEFLPRLLPSCAPSFQESSEVILLITNQGSRSKLEPVAHACAQAIGFHFAVIQADKIDEKTLVEAMAEAAVIFNEVDDWSLGFAIDELAARYGCCSVRLGNPGYSPLRYALIGCTLPSAEIEEIPRLRPLVSNMFSRRGEAPVCAVHEAFNPTTSVAWWKRLIQGKVFNLFISGNDWNKAAERDAHGHTSWLNRAPSWALLAAAGNSDNVPRAAWTLAVGTATQWLLDERRLHVGGKVRDRGLARWVRMFPTWLQMYREKAGTAKSSKTTVVRWVSSGVGWRPADIAFDPMFRECRWALEEAALPANQWPLYRAWRECWAELPELLHGGIVLDPAWRAACAEACWIHLASSDCPVEDDKPWMLLSSDPLWRESHGAVGPVLQILAALKYGRRDLARKAWRSARSIQGASTCGGFVRLARVAFQKPDEFVQWLRQSAIKETNSFQDLGVSLVFAWYRRRLWDLRCSEPDASAWLELNVAVMQLRAHCPETVARPAVLRLYVGLYCLLGDTSGVLRVIGRPGESEAGSADLASVAAIALWLRKRALDARRILGLWPESPEDPPSAIFARAAAWQLIGETKQATENLRVLLRISPKFLQNDGAADGRFVWFAVVLRQANMIREADNYLDWAKSNMGVERFRIYEQTEPGSCVVPTEWLNLAGNQ